DHRRDPLHAGQDATRARRGHHGSRDRARGRRRAAARARRPPAPRDADAGAPRREPTDLRGRRLRPEPRGVRGHPPLEPAARGAPPPTRTPPVAGPFRPSRAPPIRRPPPKQPPAAARVNLLPTTTGNRQAAPVDWPAVPRNRTARTAVLGVSVRRPAAGQL